MTIYLFNTLGMRVEYETPPDPQRYRSGCFLYFNGSWFVPEVTKFRPPVKYEWMHSHESTVPKEYRAQILLLS